MVGAVSLGEALHHRLVRRRSHRYGLLGEAQEELSSATRVSSIETKRELVHVVLQVVPADRTLVRAQQPALQQRRHTMNPRQQLRRGFLLFLQECDAVTVALPFQGKLPDPAVGVNDTQDKQMPLSPIESWAR